jgi:hypothetical protein
MIREIKDDRIRAIEEAATMSLLKEAERQQGKRSIYSDKLPFIET